MPEQAEELELPFGGYHNYLTSKDARAQAKYYFDKGYTKAQPIIDLQRFNNRDIHGRYVFTSRFKSHLVSVPDFFGKKPIIYTNWAIINELTTAPSWLYDYDLWVASFGRLTPYLPPKFSKWLIWQYTSAYKVPGLTRGYDANWFIGTLEQLNKVFGMVKEPFQILTLEERVLNLEQRVLDLERG